MARLTQASMAPGVGGVRQGNPTADLNRLLSRLQQTVMRADTERERRLRTSEYERRKVAANVDYARGLLTRLEQDALGIKVLSRRQDVQADLSSKRELLEQLAERLRELEEMGPGDDNEEGSSDGDELLSQIIATPSESLDSRSVEQLSTGERAEEEAAHEVTPMPDEPQQHAAPRAREAQRDTRQPQSTPTTKPATEEGDISEKHHTTVSPTIRARARQPEAQSQDVGHATGVSNAAAAAQRSALFGDRDKPTSASSLSQTATTEAILDHQRAEQDVLSESILALAGNLKASSQAISQSLEEDRTLLGRAGEGLDRSGRGLEAASRSMGALRRMTEGRGWLGRMLLYAMIYGLMLLLVVVVFALPKLRF